MVLDPPPSPTPSAPTALYGERGGSSREPTARRVKCAYMCAPFAVVGVNAARPGAAGRAGSGGGRAGPTEPMVKSGCALRLPSPSTGRPGQSRQPGIQSVKPVKPAGTARHVRRAAWMARE